MRKIGPSIDVPYWASAGNTVLVYYKRDGSRLLWRSNGRLKTKENRTPHYVNITLPFKEERFQRLKMKMLKLRAVSLKKVLMSNQECGEIEPSFKLSLGN